MGELQGVLSSTLKNEFIRRATPDQKRMVEPATVARQQSLLACDAWSNCERCVEQTAEWGVFAWHAATPVNRVQAIYGEAARSYYDLFKAIDFAEPVERLYSVTGRDIEKTESQLGVKFVRLPRDRDDETYGVYLGKLSRSAYAAECALTCAMIAQDWDVADRLAKETPLPLSAEACDTMTLSLLRYAVLDQKAEVEERTKTYSAYSSGVDFPPRRADFAVAVVCRDGKLLAKTLKATIQAFRRKWNMVKYVTPPMLHRYGTREKLVEDVARRLCGLRWAYSSWAVAMMCLAAHLGLERPSDPRSFSDFFLHELCMPAA